jgi:filamentous hemagglutinin family protein
MRILKKINFYVSIVLALVTAISPVYCLPQDEQVVTGSASFDRSTKDTLTVNTPSDKLIVNYSKFDIGQAETVNFIQPSSSAVALNRVTGADPSSIAGALNANGQVFVINPNGIVFTPTSRVDVAGLVASTLDISNENFLNGNYIFSKLKENAYVINQGNIQIKNGGYVALLSAAIDNQGTIQADLGRVALASGEAMTLALDDASDISVVIDEGVKTQVFGPNNEKITSAIKNSGTISANGGKVILTAKVLNKVFDYAINNTGVIEAKNIVNNNGVIEFVAEGAPVINTGTIEAGIVTITAPTTSVINKGIIKSNGSEVNPNGGLIDIKAETILQAGIITANAIENGTAGEVKLVSTTSTTLDTGSTTQARAEAIIGNGGRIIIDSTNGKTQVNKGAVIDVSAGAINGNAGYIEVGAFDQIGFYGVLNGRAPPWATAATVKFVYHSTNVPPVIIVTDQADYPASGTPIISGAGF